MKIAVLSDTHDHIWNLEKVLKQIKKPPARRGSGSERKAKAIIFCGDMCAPFTAGLLSAANVPTHLCLGNNDNDQLAMQFKGGKNFEWTPLTKEFGKLELDERKIAFSHYPKLAELLAKDGECDAVFYGHTHVARNEKVGKTLLLNPGAVCGIQNGRPGKASYAIYDTKTNSAKIIEIK